MVLKGISVAKSGRESFSMSMGTGSSTHLKWKGLFATDTPLAPECQSHNPSKGRRKGQTLGLKLLQLVILGLAHLEDKTEQRPLR
ncbi:Hypothetical predicted protein, partial [Olea europaea subsp. europaea]